MSYQIEWRSITVQMGRLLCCSFHLIKDLLDAEDSSFIGLFLKAIVTGTTYLLIWTQIALNCLGFIAWLVGAQQYLLALTSSVAVLVIAGLMLVLYEYMWRWQSIFCFAPNPNHSSEETSQIQTAMRSITIDDSMEEFNWKVWALQILRGTFIIFLWSGFCWLNTLLLFWILEQYMQAHTKHNSELFIVHNLETLPLLIGAAFCLSYLYPPMYARNAINASVETDALQSLL